MKDDGLPLGHMIQFREMRAEKKIAWSLTLRAILLLLFLLAGFAPFGKAGARPEGSSGSSGPVASQFAITDFDGDSRPDLASVQVAQSGSRDARYLIDFQLTSGLPQTISVTAPAGGLQLRSRDVNGDSYPDVIVTTYWTNQPVAVLINDGRGYFMQSQPSAFPGAFTTSESSFTSGTNGIHDTAAALFSRYLPGQCEECHRADCQKIATRLSVTRAFRILAFPGSDSFLGRAPPRSHSH